MAIQAFQNLTDIALFDVNMLKYSDGQHWTLLNYRANFTGGMKIEDIDWAYQENWLTSKN